MPSQPPLEEYVWEWYVSDEHGGRAFWYNRATKEKTWRQPPPPSATLHDVRGVPSCFRSVTAPTFGTQDTGPANISGSSAVKTGISGKAPNRDLMRKTAKILAREYALYPPSFLEKINLRQVLFCEDLHYNRQQRGDVPDLATGILFVDCGPRPMRRQRHSFHHELWHMADYKQHGSRFDKEDPEVMALNPRGFSYGKGGAHMRSDSQAGQAGTAPSPEFLNRYSTASVAEDKAEVWASLVCAPQDLHSSALQKKADLMKFRAAQTSQDMDSTFWKGVHQFREALGAPEPWEKYVAKGGREFWFNRLTNEKTWERPHGVKDQREEESSLDEMASWERHVSGGREFWYNRTTRQKSWQRPAGVAH